MVPGTVAGSRPGVDSQVLPTFSFLPQAPALLTPAHSPPGSAPQSSSTAVLFNTVAIRHAWLLSTRNVAGLN